MDTENMKIVRAACLIAALALTGLWFADIEWAVFLNHTAVSDFLDVFSGAVSGALAGAATKGRFRLVAVSLAVITVVTVVAFIVMPWDEEAEGGAALLMLWALLTLGATLVAAALLALRRRREHLKTL